MKKKKLVGLERKRLLLSGYHLTVFGALLFGVDSISKEVVGFSRLWFPRGKYLCLLSHVFECCACYSLI